MQIKGPKYVIFDTYHYLLNKIRDLQVSYLCHFVLTCDEQK
jgi:hypothetical protein